MNENAVTFRAGVVTVLGKTHVTHTDLRELRLLFDQVTDTSAAAADSLGKAGAAPTDQGLQGLRDRTARLDVLIGRAKQILY